jgi:hypothetical protein
MTTSARSTKKLSLVPKASGGSLQPSELGVALPSIQSGLKCSEETLLCLLAICIGMMSEMLSQDSMFLAMGRALGQAKAMEVSQEEFERVQAVVLKHWERRRAGHPLRDMFG